MCMYIHRNLECLGAITQKLMEKKMEVNWKRGLHMGAYTVYLLVLPGNWGSGYL